MNQESREINLGKKIESILFFKNEPVSFKLLSELTGVKMGEVLEALKTLQEFYRDRGIVLVLSDDEASFGTHPEVSGLIESLEKEEFSRELGRAGLETLAIVLYRGPISRREIDYVRGVNSSFILRNLLIRGLIERAEGASGERSYAYKATIKLLQHLGVMKKEDLPDYANLSKELEDFINSASADKDQDG